MRHAIGTRPLTVLAVLAAVAALLAVIFVPVVATRATAAPASGSISIDFEDSTLGGWEANGSPSLAYVPDPDDATNTVLSVSGRTEGYYGIQSPVGAFDEGVTYTVTARVRTAGVDQNAHFTFNETDASNPYLWVGTAGTGTDSAWVSMSGTFTPGANAGTAKLYMEVEGLVDYLIDDIVVTGEAAPEPEPCEPAFDIDFEDSTLGGWEANGSPSLAYVPDPDDATNTVLSVSGRTEGYYGIQSPVGAFDEGVTYTVTARVRTAGVDQNAHFTFNETDASNPYLWVGTAGTGTDSAWVSMSGTFTPGANAGTAKLYMEVEGLVDYLIDDIVVTFDCDGGTPEPCEPTTAEHTNLTFTDDTGAWTQNGGATLARVADPADGSNTVLSVSGRSNGYDGIQSPVGVFDEGVTYTVTAKVRTNGAAGAAHFTYNEPDASNQWLWVGNTDTGTASEWVTVTGTFMPGANAANAKLYMEVEGLLDYLLDDVVITYEEPCDDGEGPEPGTVMLNADFEDGLQGWVPRHSGAGDHTVNVTTDDAHGGAQSALVSGRTSQGSGIGFDVDGLLEPGQQYELTAWLKFAETPVEDIVLSAQTGSSTFNNLLTFTGMSNGEWVQVTGKFAFAAGDMAFLYFETPWEGEGVTGNTSSFMIDDITVIVPEPAVIQDLTPIKSTLPFPAGVAIDQRETTGASAQLLLKHFNQISAENFMKPEAWYDANGNWAPNSAQIDSLMDFAVENDLDVYGHVLVWHSQTPASFFQVEGTTTPLTTSETDKQVLRDRMREHIFNVAEYLSAWGEYGGDNPITAWDVVNEVVDDSAAYDDGLRRSEWYRILGEEFIHLAFQYADEAFNEEYAAAAADRPVTLFINDYNTEQSGKRARYLALIDRLLAADVPIDGIGHQFHLNLSMPVSNLEAAIVDAQGRGLIQAVTEFDVTTGTPESEAKFIDQGYYYRDAFEIFRTYQDELFCVTIWGLIDSRSWRDANGGPLAFDDDFQAKPAYYGIVNGAGGEDPLPAPLRTADVFAGSVAVDAAAPTALEWSQLPLRIFDGASGWQARWAADHLTVYVTVDDASIDAADEVTFIVEGDSYTVNRDGTGDVSAVTDEHTGGYSMVAHVPLNPAVVQGDTVQFDVRTSDNGTDAGWNAEGVLGTLTLVEELSFLEVPQAELLPEIDARKDWIWQFSQAVQSLKVTSGTGGAVGSFHTLWDENTLYVYAVIDDPTVDLTGSDPWTQDSVEIYIDGGNFKNGSYRYDDMQLRVNADNVVSFGTGDEAFQAARVDSATKRIPGGYIVEVAISLQEYGGLNSFQGVDFQVNDASGGTRTGIRNWADPTGAGYQSTARWGVAQLVEGVDVEVPDFPMGDEDLTDDNKVCVVTAPASAQQGTALTLTLCPEYAGDDVDVYIYSDPVLIGGGTTSGAATLSVTIPANTAPGVHKIAVYDVDGFLIGWTDITVVLAAGALGDTGAHVTGAALLAAVLVLFGGFALWSRRRIAPKLALT